jgi:uncharacterized protein YkwD
MKRLFVAVASLSFLMASHVLAAQTNLVQSLRFDLTACFQGANVTNQNLVTYSVAPQRISNADIIQALETSLSQTFTIHAALRTVTVLPNGPETVVIQDGTNRVDVTGFFVDTFGPVQVVKGVSDTSSGQEHQVQYGNRTFRLRNKGGSPALTLNFQVAGFAQDKLHTLSEAQGTIIGMCDEFSATVAGTVTLNGQDAVAHGYVTRIGRAVEVLN